jgi:hypothetical protein
VTNLDAPEAEESAEEPPPPEWCQICGARYRVHPDGTRTCACDLRMR